MFKSLKNAWTIPELKSKLLFTLFIIILYRIGAQIPIPFINYATLTTVSGSYLADGSILQYFNILSGDAFSKATLFALSVSPYITSSIVMQLLTIAIPALERLSKQGEEGQKKITQITRYVTLLLALITAYGYYVLMKQYGLILDTNKDVFAAFVVIACYTAGAALIMWLSEKINDQGIGNGISIILFANIVAGIPSMVSSFVGGLGAYINYTWLAIVIGVVVLAAVLASVVFVVFMTNSERRIPVQYAKRVVGRKMYGGQSTNLPIKLNMAGVMPIIFANTLVSVPTTILSFINLKEGTFWYKVSTWLSYMSPIYSVILFVLIIAFSYFYISISFNPLEVSNNLMKNGGFVPGIRPGKPTAAYITKILNKITLMGAFFLSIVAVLPLVVNMITALIFPAATSGILGSLAFSGNSLLIVVGVALETVREIESQMTARHYKGFLE